MKFPDDSTAGGNITPWHAVWWGSNGIIYETIKMNLEKSFCDIYLFVNINFFPQEVCRKLLDFEFSYIKFSQIDRNIYLLIYLLKLMV